MKIGNIEPYPYQQDIIDDCLNHIRAEYKMVTDGVKKSCDAGLVEAYVSAGKTIIIGAISSHCVRVGARVLVLSRQSELVKQNAEECWNMEVKSSIFSASLACKSTKNKVIVASTGTAVNELEGLLVDFKPNVILIDECHQVDHVDLLNDKNTDYSKILTKYMNNDPRLIIIGFTGTPYRGINSIISEKGFWKKRIGDPIDREFLVENNYIVPTLFGLPDVKYDFSNVKSGGEDGIKDFTKSALEEMEKNIDDNLTKQIVEDFVKKTKHRNSVLITCASFRHCKDVAKYLPKGSFEIVTTNTSVKSRADKMERIKKGKVKYTLQIGCLTTGVNVPLWDTSVILRKIGSLTLLVQLLGRGMRKLKQYQIDAGYIKNDHVVLDYSGTLDELYSLYEDPILDQAILEISKRKKQTKKCPACGFENSEMAQRCINKNDNGDRCEYFWDFIECDKCKTKNTKTSRECRNCNNLLIDYNKNLTNKHYTKDDFYEVKNMLINRTKNGGLFIVIKFVRDIGDAKLFFSPFNSKKAKMLFRQNFLQKFTKDWKKINLIMRAKHIDDMIKLINGNIKTPKACTHRINQKGYSIVNTVILDEE